MERRINDLGNNELMKIFCQFTVKERLLLQLVCRKWKSVIEEIPVKLRLTDGGYVRPKFVAHPKTCCRDKRHQHLEVLQIGSTTVAKKILRRFYNATVLSMEALSVERLFDLAPILVEHFKRLEHLELKFTFGSFTNEAVIFISKISVHTLKHLWLLETDPEQHPSRNQPFDPTILLSLIRTHPKLESLFLNCVHTELITEVELPPKLKSLAVGFCTMPQMFTFCEGANQLRKLVLPFAEKEDLWWICGNIANLKSLVIYELRVYSRPDLRPLKCLKRLKKLHLGLREKLSFAASDESESKADSVAPSDAMDLSNLTAEIVGLMKDLKSLQLKGFGITDKFLFKLPQVCPNLERLAIENYDKGLITDAGLEPLVELPFLKELSIPSTVITTVGVSDLLRNCASLKSLGLDISEPYSLLVVKMMMDKAILKPEEEFTLTFCGPRQKLLGKPKSYKNLKIENWFRVSDILLPFRTDYSSEQLL